MMSGIRVLLVGTFHFDSRRDAVRPDAFDVSDPDRQREIADVVQRLTRYRPSKILLELDAADAAEINRRYHAYRNGGYELATGEAENLGFRLADACSREWVYPVNDREPSADVDLEAVARSSSRTERVWHEFEQHLADGTDRQNRRQRLPVPDHLAALNAQGFRDRGLAVYLSILARLVHGADRAGADLVGAWYHRNARIYANILEVAEPDDRLLVLIGSGHVPVLWHFFDAAGDYALDDPVPYLLPDSDT